MSGIAVLLRRFASAHVRRCGSFGALALGACPALRFCWGACPRRMSGDTVLLGRLPSAHIRLCVSVAVLCLGSRLLFAAWRQTGRLAMCSVPIPPGRDRLRAFSRCWRGYLSWRVHFGFGRLFLAISTGYRGTEERGTGLAARRLCVFAQSHRPCESFRWEYVGGCAPPNLRQRVFDSLDSLHAAAGLRWCEHISSQKAPALQSLYPRLQNPGTRKDLTGSDLWPVRSCCIEMLPTRTNVQTRAALKRRGVGLRARSGEEAGTAGWSGGSCCTAMIPTRSNIQTRSAPKR